MAAVPAFSQTNVAAPVEPATVGDAAATNKVAPPKRPRPLSYRPQRTMGSFVKIDGTNLVLVVRNRGGSNEVVVPIEAQTEYRVNNVIGSVKDLKPGMLLLTTHLPAMSDRPGKLSVVARNPEQVGVVVSSGGTNLVIKVTEPGSAPRELPIVITETTKILMAGPEVNGQPSTTSNTTLDELKPGMKVAIWPGIGPATRITATPLPVPAAKPDSAPEKK